MNIRENGKEYIRKLINISYMSIGVPLLVFVWIYLEVLSDRVTPILDPEYHQYALGIVLAISLSLGAFSYTRGKKLLQNAKTAQVLSAKLMAYKKKIGLQHAVYGIISGIIAIGLYLTAYAPFEFLFFIMIFLVSVHQPNASRTIRDLDLKDAEKDVIVRGLDF